MTRSIDTHLRPLEDSDLTLPHSVDDIRWHHVVDPTGHEIGRVEDLIVDEEQRKVRFLRVASGGFLGLGTHKVLVPAEAIGTIRGEVVYLTEHRDRIVNAPVYDPELVSNDYYASVYDYFGY